MRSPLAALLLAAAAPAQAGSLAGPVEARVERVIDGDTFKARAAIWVDQEIVVSVRVAGIDAPELSRAACPAEKARAVKAQAFTAAFLGAHAILTDIRHDKYAGRVLARVANGASEDLGAALIGAGLASSGENAVWCPTS